MLELVDIHTYYGESHILQGVSLRVNHRSITGLLVVMELVKAL